MTDIDFPAPTVPPLTPAELALLRANDGRVTLDQFNSVPAAPNGNGNGNGKVKTLPLFRSLAEVEEKSIRFLDKPLWQRGAFHLLVGQKGSGKGTYLALLA